MSSCKLDHPIEDVNNKLESQKKFLPVEIYHSWKEALQKQLDQTTLNELFHLLKKYDLASVEEQKERNVQFRSLFEKRK